MSKISNDYKITFHDGSKYAFDIDRIKEICLISGEKQITDVEIQDLTNIGETEDDSYVSQKILKENKYFNFQTDVLMLDLVKQFISYMVELNAQDIAKQKESERQETISQALIFNTCLSSGIIKKID